MLDGRLSFTYAFMGIDSPTITSSVPLAEGRVQVRYEFVADAPGTMGTGGTQTLYVDDAPVASGRLEQTVSTLFSAFAGFDIGRDNGMPVVRAPGYAAPFPFSGVIGKVTFALL